MPNSAAAGTLGDLVFGLNHEIRTSMNGVAGMLALLLDSGLTPAQRQLAADAQGCAEELMGLIENIVDFSMLEAGSFALAQESFDMVAVLHAASAAPLAAARERGLALHLNFPPALMLRGDPYRLQQIIGSLLHAALDTAAHGPISVDVRADGRGAAHRRLSVTISAPALNGNAQKPTALLSQPDLGHLAALRAHGRIGLDLALCGRLARLMDAQIEVRNQDGESHSICFSVELPCAPSAADGVRTLLLAQHAADGDELAAQLHADGMQVDCFASVTEALAALGAACAERAPYRIAILGGRIQGMDCEILGAAIKADPAYRDLRLVALREWPRTGGEAELEQAGFCAVIPLPLQHGETQAVARALCKTIDSGHAPRFIAPDALTPSLAGRRVLVADDNPVNRQVAQRLVKNMGCLVDVAVDGEQAVAMHATRPYDLILMDCQMPQLDGYQATERIRALDGSVRRTPIVAVTACAAQGERAKCLERGMDDFIAKPVRPQVLHETIGRWLTGAAPAADVPGADSADELDVVRDMFGADFAELAMLYQNDSPSRIAALHRAGAAQDYPQVAKVAHALSGSSVSIGATGLSAMCKELEMRAKACELDDFARRLAAIDAEYNRISGKLRSMVDAKAEVA